MSKKSVAHRPHFASNEMDVADRRLHILSKAALSLEPGTTQERCEVSNVTTLHLERGRCVS